MIEINECFNRKLIRRLFEEKDEVDMKFFLFCFLFFFVFNGDGSEDGGGGGLEEGKDLRKKKDDMWIQYSSIEITLTVESLVD